EVGTATRAGMRRDEPAARWNREQYVHGLAAAAARSGASIVTGVAADRMQKQSGRWLVETTGGVVETRDVLVATNGYTNGAAPSLQRRFVPIGSYIIATAALDASLAAALLPRRRRAFDAKHLLYYFRVATARPLL